MNEIRPIIGDSLRTILDRATRLAEETNGDVEFVFNGKHMSVKVDGSVETDDDHAR